MKCRKCSTDYRLGLLDIGKVMMGKASLSFCPDCLRNQKWYDEYREWCNAGGSEPPINEALINTDKEVVFQPNVSNYLIVLGKIADKNKYIYEQKQKRVNADIHYMVTELWLEDADMCEYTIPIAFDCNYLTCYRALRDENANLGLYLPSKEIIKIPIYKILKVRAFPDYMDAVMPIVPVPVYGFKVVPDVDGELKTRGVVYKLGEAQEEKVRNCFITDYQDCYLHFCKNIEDLFFCPGGTDFITSQAHYAPGWQLYRVFIVKAEGHIVNGTGRGYAASKLTLVAEVPKQGIIEYFESKPEAKEDVLNHVCKNSSPEVLWKEYIDAKIPKYAPAGLNDEQKKILIETAQELYREMFLVRLSNDPYCEVNIENFKEACGDMSCLVHFLAKDIFKIPDEKNLIYSCYFRYNSYTYAHTYNEIYGRIVDSTIMQFGNELSPYDENTECYTKKWLEKYSDECIKNEIGLYRKYRNTIFNAS